MSSLVVSISHDNFSNNHEKYKEICRALGKIIFIKVMFYYLGCVLGSYQALKSRLLVV